MSFFSPKQQECLRYLEGDEYREVTEVFLGGGAGGGKSFTGCHWQIARRLQYPGTRGCIGRSQLKTLKKTTLKTFSDVWIKWYANNPKGIIYTINWQDGIMYFSNGSEIVLQDLFEYPSDPDFTTFGSLEITDLFIDEAPEITLKAFEILQSRIRYKLINGVPKALLTGNPQPNWVKYRYVKQMDGREAKLEPYQKYVPCLVADNPDEAFRDIYTQNLEKLSPYDRERLLHGSWDVIDNPNSVFYGYSNEKHFSTEQYEVNPDYFLDISFDFNINPCTAIIGQFDRVKMEWHIFDLILANPQTMAGLSPLQAVCKQIKNRYIDNGRIVKNRIRITGDPSGKQGSADRQEARSFYYTISKELQIQENQFYVRSAHTTHVYSVAMMNYAMTSLPQGNLIFHNQYELADDMRTVYWHEKSLEKAKGDKTLSGFHILDASRYLFDFWFSYHTRFITDDNKVQVFVDSIVKKINQKAA